MAKRRFVCTPADLERFGKRWTQIYEDYHAKSPKSFPTIEYAMRGYIYRKLQELQGYGIVEDEITVEAFVEFDDNPTLNNLHYLAHHLVWQLLESYDARNPAMNLIDHCQIDLWRKATADCQFVE